MLPSTRLWARLFSNQIAELKITIESLSSADRLGFVTSKHAMDHWQAEVERVRSIAFRGVALIDPAKPLLKGQ